jgi:hypothetical protein
MNRGILSLSVALAWLLVAPGAASAAITYTMLRGDSPVTIGDSLPLWEVHFGTPERVTSHPAMLMFNVSGLTQTNLSVIVKVNGTEVGRIYRYDGGNGGHWFTQMIHIAGNQINDGDNVLQIQAVSWPGATSTNLYDDFSLKDVVVFYHYQP